MMDECGEADKGLEICSGLLELDRDYGYSACCQLLLLAATAAIAAVLLRLHAPLCTYFYRLCWFANAAGRC